MDPLQNLIQDPPQDARLQADIAWLEGIRRQIKSPSPRNPDLSWHTNAADHIEWQMQQDDHRTWGFVIYRITYDSDADWAEFLRRLRWQMEDTFDFYNGRDILDKFTLIVFEDQSLFDGVSTDTVRRHFQKWASTVYRIEQQPEEGTENTNYNTIAGIGRSPRYRFALQVDSESLHSVVYDAVAPPELDTTKKGWVKLIDKSWYLGRSEGRYSPLEPIEGVTEQDVGWMKVDYWNVMTKWYTLCRSPNNWGLNYRRPPEVV